MHLVNHVLSRSFRSLFLGVCVIFGAAVCAQEAPPVNPSTGAEDLPWAKRQALALEILASVQASGPSDSMALPLQLYRVAGAWAPFDASRAASLYREAFSFARGANIKVREPLETAILNELLPLSPSSVAELVPDAEAETQNRLFASLIIYWLYQGEYPKAIEAFDSAVARGILPKDGVTLALLTTLSTKSSVDDRAHVFGEVIRYCRPHPEHYDALASWVDRLYTQMPPGLVHDAVHTVLVEAEMDDWRHPWGGISLGGGSGSVKLHSHYDLELFRVGPALQKLGPNEFSELINRHREVADALNRFPNGFRSLAPNDYLFSYVVIPNHPKPADLDVWSNPGDPLNLMPQDLGLELSRPRPLAGFIGGDYLYQPNGPEQRIVAQLRACPPDVLQRLAELAPTVPIQRKVPFSCEGPTTGVWCSYLDTYPRVDLFESVASGCINLGNAAGSQAALHDLDDILSQVPEQRRVDFIAQEADFYLHLGEGRAAADVVDEGFRLAANVYDRDAKSATLKGFPASLWDAAEIYRRMVTLGVYASLDRTREIVSGIPDASLRAMEEVMMARALLGVPVRRTIALSASGQVQADEGYSYAGPFWR